MARKGKNLAGQRFGRLVAIEPTEERYRTAVIWKCQCDCGNTVSIPVSCLTSGDVSSCGCLRKETGRLAMKKLQKNNVFGTNLSSIKRPDEELQKNNTSGITGVCQVRGVWIAYCAFQGYPYRQYCSSKDEAILVRKILRQKRDEFLNSLKVVNIIAKSVLGNKMILNIDAKSGKISLSATQSDLGKNESTFEGEIEGKDIKIAFSARLLSDILNHLNSEDIIFECSEAVKPGVFKIEGEKDFVHLVMPMML